MPDLKEIIIPREAGKESESLIVMWHKKPGESFSEGETLVEIQTDKATMEVPAQFAGVIKEIKVARGGTAKTGQVIAIAAAA